MLLKARVNSSIGNSIFHFHANIAANYKKSDKSESLLLKKSDYSNWVDHFFHFLENKSNSLFMKERRSF